MKHFTFLLLSFLLFSGCKKNGTDEDLPVAPGNSKNPFANIKLANNGVDVFQWSYQGADKFSNIKWTDLSGGSSKVIAELTSFAYNGANLAKIEANVTTGEKNTYTGTYNGNKLTKVSSANSANSRVWNFEAEYDAQGRVSQFNRYRTNGSVIEITSNYVLTYDAVGNVSKAVFTQGSTSRTYVFKYDTRDNKAYNNADLFFISMGEVSSYLNHFWGLPFMLSLTKNNVTEMATEGTSEKHLYTYQFDGSGNITSVKDDWTLSNGGKQVSDWTITTK